MLSQADEDVLATCYRHLQERPIEPGHPFYVEIWEHSDHDPIQRLRKHILWTEIESLQLFSGFNGSGKTTQLRRLKQELEEQGYLVIYADADEYLNLREPIEVEELLVTIAGAFSGQIDSSLLTDSYWKRFVNYLEAEVKLSEITFKTDPVSFKAELKSSPTLRQRIRKAIESRLPEFRRQVQAFVDEAVRAVYTKTPGRRIVFLFDSFEKLRGTLSNEDEVMASVERVFGRNMNVLQLPGVHCVYSVPAFVPFFVGNAEVVLIPSIKLWKKRVNGEEQPHEAGQNVMRQILEKRFGHAQHRLFGEPDGEGRYTIAEALIDASGGDLRYLLRLFREALLATKSLPISERVAKQAIATVRNDFKPSIEDARWLDKIHREQAADPQTAKAADVNRFMRLLDSHMILLYKNETSWYDSLPLIREEVERILASNPAPVPE
ncbi:MAG TPA: hypothetical protein VMF91_20860 [Bryobacteraceae bacterium]|nr:hypothetical protein [Bryobacteraceae bacterium]